METTDDLFSETLNPGIVSIEQNKEFRPLADRMRPQKINEFVGQKHLLDKNMVLTKAIESGQLHSMVLWGPPGTGKTTLATLIANYCQAKFISVSAVLSGVKEIRTAISRAEINKNNNIKSILFVDEVHRFNKSQQDAFLPFIENGLITFIGATTENPSFELNNALLSRARIYVLKSLETDDIIQSIDRALADKVNGFGQETIIFPQELKIKLAEYSDGDLRRALNFLELSIDFAKATINSTDRANQITINESILNEILVGSVRRYDKGGEIFYDQISALHKSIRGSAPDAALYWFSRMIDAGCDALYIARRVVRMASEDIGNADPRALQMALNAWDVQDRLGSPEGELAIAHAITYLACAPKSNAVYKAYNLAMLDAQNKGSLEVPLHLRNAPTKLMAQLDYGKNYRYAHDELYGYAAGENYFPDEMSDDHSSGKYYNPVDRGLEIKITQRLEFLKKLDKEKKPD
ncbi:MAG: replication-associated recombination protein A [Thiohalomonadales bacterium]